jgi:tetratricopeptide (TPR) repeat protein
MRNSLEQNQTAAALALSQSFESDNADQPDALLKLAGILAKYSQHERAAEVYGRINLLRPHSPNVLYNQGIALYQCRQLDRAVAALADSADLDGTPAQPHYVLALIAGERLDHENSIQELRHAIQRNGRQADYYSLLGEEYKRVGYWQGAADAFRRAADLEPVNSTNFLRLGDALFRIPDLEGAIRAFEQADRLDSGIPQINYLIGLACQKNGQFERAASFYERQLKLDPDHLNSLLGAGEAAIEQNQLDQAEEFLHSALKNSPEDAQANYDLGLVCFKTQRYERSIELFRRVLRLRPDHTEAEYHVYLALSRSHQQAAALDALAAWKKLEALDRKVRSQEVAYESARVASWKGNGLQGVN